jgi:hypothetical protein
MSQYSFLIPLGIAVLITIGLYFADWGGVDGSR